MKTKNIQGLTFIESLIMLMIIAALIAASFALRASMNDDDNAKRFINDSVNTDRKIKEIDMNFNDVIKSEKDIYKIFKDKFMINSLKCNTTFTECSFNKNTGTEEYSLFSSYISVQIEKNKIIMLQKVSSFNGYFDTFSQKTYTNYYIYTSAYDNYLKTEYESKVRVVYYLADETDTDKEISKKECRKNEKCILVAKYTQKK